MDSEGRSDACDHWESELSAPVAASILSFEAHPLQVSSPVLRSVQMTCKCGLEERTMSTAAYDGGDRECDSEGEKSSMCCQQGSIPCRVIDECRTLSAGRIRVETFAGGSARENGPKRQSRRQSKKSVADPIGKRMER
ncbi:hypothetical protein EDD16DRAFT_1724371 [Pisolithus croceorrhizus]|nr:hypothetical protein EDD16DRAFT_1724371 [Pisolithus croceorrhizus]